MPSHEEHCQESLRRYGKTFSELHRWMDEPSEIMGSKHRMYRHDPYATPKEARALFGEYADQACLDHIRADTKSWRRQRLKATSPRGKSQLPSIVQGMLLLFFAFILFTMGLLFLDPIAIKYGGWFFAPILWFLAFLCFWGFLGAIITKKEEPSPVYHYELEMPPQYWIPRKEDEKQNEEKTTRNKNDSEGT